MAIEILSSVWNSNFNSLAEKMVMLVLANYSDHDGFSYPSQSTIAKKAQLSRETVNRVLSDLESRKLLKSKRKYSNGSRSYVIDRQFLPVTRDHTPCDERSQDLCAEITPPVTRDHTIRHRTVNKPSGERIPHIKKFVNEIHKQLEAAKKIASTYKESHSVEVATGTHWDSEECRAEYREHKNLEKKLLKELAEAQVAEMNNEN